MYSILKRQGFAERAGSLARRTRTLQRAAVVFLTATVVNLSTASAAQQAASQVDFTAYRDHRGIMIQDGGHWPAAPTGPATVEAYPEHGAIRLTFKPADGSALSTGMFERIDGSVAPAALGLPAETVLDVRGVYRADLHDATGATVGWLRVRVSPFDVAPRIYDGNVPATLSPQSLTTALAQLDAEIDRIEAHAQDVYLGN